MANAFRVYINLWINPQIKLQEVYFQTNVRAHAYAFVVWKIHIYGCRLDIECTRSSNQDHEFLTRSYNSNRDKVEHCFYDYISQFSITFAFHGGEFGIKKYIQNYGKKGKSEIFARNTELIFEISITIELHRVEFQKSSILNDFFIILLFMQN